DENPIRTLRDYFKASHEGYKNTIELSEGNNVVPLRSDTIRLVQNGYSFQGLWSEDPNQHLKDFLKLVDLLDLDVANREEHACKIPSKLLLSMRPRLTMKWEGSSSLRTKEQETSTKPPMVGRIGQTLIGHGLKPSKVYKLARSPPTPLLDDTPTPDTTRNSMAHMNLASIDYIKKEELQSKESEANEERSVKPNLAECNDHKRTVKAKEEVGEESEEELEEETEEETKEKEKEDDLEYFDTFPTMEELGYHEWLLKNP
nr:MAK10-like protein [Tanacetum cinerariifolium]